MCGVIYAVFVADCFNGNQFGELAFLQKTWGKDQLNYHLLIKILSKNYKGELQFSPKEIYILYQFLNKNRYKILIFINPKSHLKKLKNI